MAGDMMLLMRGLAKLSQAVVETQSSTLRTGEFQHLNDPHLLNVKSSLLAHFFRDGVLKHAFQLQFPKISVDSAHKRLVFVHFQT